MSTLVLASPAVALDFYRGRTMSRTSMNFPGGVETHSAKINPLASPTSPNLLLSATIIARTYAAVHHGTAVYEGMLIRDDTVRKSFVYYYGRQSSCQAARPPSWHGNPPRNISSEASYRVCHLRIDVVSGPFACPTPASRCSYHCWHYFNLQSRERQRTLLQSGGREHEQPMRRRTLPSRTTRLPSPTHPQRAMRRRSAVTAQADGASSSHPRQTLPQLCTDE